MHCELLLVLGASQERAGSGDAKTTFAAAAAVARALGDAGLLGRAALGYAGRWSQLGRVEEDVAALLQDALAGLGDEEVPLRARLLARLALELYYAGDPERRLALSDEAVELARRLGDPQTLATCLDARHYALWRPETVHERLEVASELRRIAETVGDPELELEGAGWTVVDLLELGDIAGRRHPDRRRVAARRGAPPPALRVVDVAVPLRAGAARRATSTRPSGSPRRRSRSGSAARPRTPPTSTRSRCSTSAASRGASSRSRRRVRGMIGLYPAVPAWRCSLALLQLELGREDAAAAEFEAVAAAGFDTLPRDANWLIAITLLAEVCARLGDADRAGELYAALAPYAGRNVLVGRGATCNGSASRHLGALAAAQRDWPRAEEHFAAALAMHEAMGARPFVARTQLAWAEMELARGDAGAARGAARRGDRDRRRARDARRGGAGALARRLSSRTAGIEGGCGPRAALLRCGFAAHIARMTQRSAFVAARPRHAVLSRNRAAVAIRTLPRCPPLKFVPQGRTRPAPGLPSPQRCHARRPSSPAQPAATRSRSGTAAAPAAASGTRSSRRPAHPPRPHGAAAAPRPRAASVRPVRLADVQAVKVARLQTGIGELDRVLGGGLVPGSLVLLGGSPGIGKSTLTSMALGNLAGAGRRTLYVSGEESAAQIKLRAERLPGAALEVPVLAETDLDTVLATLDAERPEVCVVDSVQTLHAADLTGAAGSVGQVREVADRITRLAKARDIAVLLVGHVTKEGALAGPRVLEHLVDCVLQFEGERERTYRTLRALKNRFGSTSEAGVFEMRQGGLVEVQDASARFVGEATRAPGSVVLAAMEGSRPLLVEVQALVSPVRARPAAPRRQRDRPQPARARARRAGAPRRRRRRQRGRVRQRRGRRPRRRARRRPGGRARRRERRARRRRAGDGRAPDRLLRRDRADRRAAQRRPPRAPARRGAQVRARAGDRSGRAPARRGRGAALRGSALQGRAGACRAAPARRESA